MNQARVPINFFHFALEHAWKIYAVLPHRRGNNIHTMQRRQQWDHCGTCINGTTSRWLSIIIDSTSMPRGMDRGLSENFIMCDYQLTTGVPSSSISNDTLTHLSPQWWVVSTPHHHHNRSFRSISHTVIANHSHFQKKILIVSYLFHRFPCLLLLLPMLPPPWRYTETGGCRSSDGWWNS